MSWRLAWAVVRNGKEYSEEIQLPHLRKFQEAVGAKHAFQVVFDLPYEAIDCFAYEEPVVVPAKTFLSQLDRDVLSKRLQRITTGSAVSVMTLAGRNFKMSVGYSKNETVFLINADAPPARPVFPEWLWLSDAGISVAFNALEKLVDPTERFLVLTLPGNVLFPCAVMPVFLHGGCSVYGDVHSLSYASDRCQ